MQFPEWTFRAHPDYARLTAVPGSAYSCLMPWALRATTRAYRLELEGASSVQPATVIDAMAHVGCDTLHFLRMFPRAQVIAVEPEPATAAALRANIATARSGSPGRVRVVEADCVEFLGLAAGSAAGSSAGSAAGSAADSAAGSAAGSTAGSAAERLRPRADMVYFDPPWCESASASECATAPPRRARLTVGSLSLGTAVGRALRYNAPLVVAKLPPAASGGLTAEALAAEAAAALGSPVSVSTHSILKPQGSPAYTLAFARVA